MSDQPRNLDRQSSSTPPTTSSTIPPSDVPPHSDVEVLPSPSSLGLGPLLHHQPRHRPRRQPHHQPHHSTQTSPLVPPSTSISTADPALHALPFHNEFDSLLEAAQRIANSTSRDIHGRRWREDEQPEPVIHLRRPADTYQSRAAYVISRYAGRPHVPGEDRGSEYEAIDHPRRPRMDSPRDSHSPASHQSPELARDPIQVRLEQSRRLRSSGEETQARLVGLNSRSDSQAQYSTTGPSPSRDFFYDWAPEAAGPRDRGQSDDARTRSPSQSSSRRWRPAERLQDFAIQHARANWDNTRASLEALFDRDRESSRPSWAPPAPPAPPAPAEQTTATITTAPDHTTRPAAATQSDHNDIVDRVERALQEYRLARRALRQQNSNISSGLWTPPSPPIARSHPSLAASGELQRSGQDIMEARAARMNTSSTERQEALSRRIREQARDRRRRIGNLLQTVEQETSPGSFATGPLFDSSRPSTRRAARMAYVELPSARDELRADTRRMLEKIKRAEARARTIESKQATATLQYLARLREEDMTEVKAWTLASDLSLHNRSLGEVAETQLPLSVHQLPHPVYSSWLEPGTTWIGTQSAEPRSRKRRGSSSREPSHGSRAELDDQGGFYNIPPRDRVHPRPENAVASSTETDSNPHADPISRLRETIRLLDDVDNSNEAGTRPSSLRLLESAERDLSRMLEQSGSNVRENEQRLRDNGPRFDSSVLRESPRRPARPVTGRQSDRDKWNVKVTLHSVDWQDMTLTGTMTASHSQDLSIYSGVGQQDEQQGFSPLGPTMDSFFTGEIIDFRTHGLDTVTSKTRDAEPSTARETPSLQNEWRVGGPEVDTLYWASLGPFKRQVERDIAAREAELERSDQQKEVPRQARDSTQSSSDVSEPQHRDHGDGPVSTLPTTPNPSQANDMDVSSDNKLPTLSDTILTNPDPPILVTLTAEEKHNQKFATMARLLSDTEWLKANISCEGWILMRWKERCFVSPGTDPNPDVRRPWIPSQQQQGDSGGPALASRATGREIAGDEEGGTLGRLIRYTGTHAPIPLSDSSPRGISDSDRAWMTFAPERDEAERLSPQAGGERGRELREPTWGLTISGFYYVALDRKTGRIEALYYDSGSLPLQRLEMNTDLGGARIVQETGKEADVSMRGVEEVKAVNVDAKDGLRTAFSLVEFR